MDCCLQGQSEGFNPQCVYSPCIFLNTELFASEVGILAYQHLMQCHVKRLCFHMSHLKSSNSRTIYACSCKSEQTHSHAHSVMSSWNKRINALRQLLISITDHKKFRTLQYLTYSSDLMSQAIRIAQHKNSIISLFHSQQLFLNTLLTYTYLINFVKIQLINLLLIQWKLFLHVWKNQITSLELVLHSVSRSQLCLQPSHEQALNDFLNCILLKLYFCFTVYTFFVLLFLSDASNLVYASWVKGGN